MAIKSYEDMQIKKSELSGILISMAECIDELNELGMDLTGQSLLDLQKRLKNDNFKVLVLGEFKNGKSTLINALLGDNILPAYSTPCTAVINEIKYGNYPVAKLYFKNPLPEEMTEYIAPKALQHIKRYQRSGEIPPIDLDINDLEDYVTIQDIEKEQIDAIKEVPYSKAIIEYPLKLCKDGVEIIDSPGLNENEVRTKVTEEYLKNADAVIFVSRCPKLAGQDDVSYVENNLHSRQYKDIFFVCTAIDQIPVNERNRLMKFGNSRLAKLTDLGENGIFYINSYGALTAKKNRNNAALKESGIIDFEEALSDYLTNNRGKQKIIPIINGSSNYLNDVKNNHIKGYMNSLNMGVQELENRITNAMPKLEEAKRNKENIEKRLDVELGVLENKIFDMAVHQIDMLCAQIPNFVDNEMNIDNYMTMNPFKQKERKKALENEVINKLNQFVESKMAEWSNMELKKYIDLYIDNLQRQIGRDIDKFYSNIDQFRFEISGVKTTKNISPLNRVLSTILGTAIGGPAYAFVGASMGFGEMFKRSAVGVSLTALTAVIAPTIAPIVLLVYAGSGILHVATAGKSLTKKYKNALKKEFVKKLSENKNESCKNCAAEVRESVKEKFDLISQALKKEIEIEESKIDVLREDKNRGLAAKAKKEKALKEVSSEMEKINKQLISIKKEVEK